MDKWNAGSFPDVADEFFRGLLERIVRRQIIHHHSKGVMPVETLTEMQWNEFLFFSFHGYFSSHQIQKTCSHTILNYDFK